jgi:S-adenosylmethionine-diacylglycerol 3-amino-3-carboxypropyl transferase
MKSFLETLNYSSSNEDSLSELRSLHIAEGDSVLCITGSGGRPLDLLIEKPAKIVSIDFNPCQNFLLELKMVAIQQLEYQEFLEFMGIVSSQNREQTYKALRNTLSADARNFWDAHLSIIKRGVIYQGRWEKYFGMLARTVSFMRSKLRDRLFACENTAEEARIWHDEWNDLLWHLFLNCISSRKVWKYIFGDPGFYEHVPEGFSISDYLSERFAFASENVLFSESPFMTLLFFGRSNTDGALPPYLCKGNYATIKNNLSCIQIITQSLSEYLENCEGNRFNKYSLSDFSSYTNCEEYAKIWKHIVRTASPGAIVCERQFLVKRETPSEVRQFVMRDVELERELSRTDNSCFYTFIIGRIHDKTA